MKKNNVDIKLKFSGQPCLLEMTFYVQIICDSKYVLKEAGWITFSSDIMRNLC